MKRIITLLTCVILLNLQAAYAQEHIKNFAISEPESPPKADEGKKVRLLSKEEQDVFLKLRKKQLYGESTTPKKPVSTRMKAFYETMSRQEKQEMRELLAEDGLPVKTTKQPSIQDTLKANQAKQKDEWKSLSDKEKERRKSKMLNLFKSLPESEKAKINEIRKRARENRTDQ